MVGEMVGEMVGGRHGGRRHSKRLFRADGWSQWGAELNSQIARSHHGGDSPAYANTSRDQYDTASIKTLR